jgi:hypothetical protein
MDSIAYNPDRQIAAAADYMQRIGAPTIQQQMVAGGQGALSGAAIEAQQNAIAQLAMPILQQVAGVQQRWYEPQLQGAIQGGLGQQTAQNQLLGQGFGGALTGLASQQQNIFNQAMQQPAALNQLLHGQQSAYGQMYGLADLSRQMEMQDSRGGRLWRRGCLELPWVSPSAEAVRP